MKLAYTKIYRPRRKKKFPHLVFFAALIVLLFSLGYGSNNSHAETPGTALLSAVLSGGFFQKAQAAE